MHLIAIACISLIITLLAPSTTLPAGDPMGPEEVVRALVRANAEKDLPTMRMLMAQDPDMIGYTIGGRKYVGWTDFARDMQLEFHSVARLEIPITELNVWTRNDTAWFAMELDYVRYEGEGSRVVLPLRETGILERRNGRWVLVSWHESARTNPGLQARRVGHTHEVALHASASHSEKPDLSGEWEIQEEDKSYTASLNRDGNGTYSWQNGRITTTEFTGGTWLGTWQQSGNDREGGFEVLLAEDGTGAKGVWWYSRVGDRQNIPERQWGGSYTWKRLTPPPTPPTP